MIDLNFTIYKHWMKVIFLGKICCDKVVFNCPIYKHKLADLYHTFEHVETVTVFRFVVHNFTGGRCLRTF